MKKIWLFIILLLLISIPTTVFLVAQSQEMRKKATPATTLSIRPANLAKNVGDIFSLDTVIDTADNQVVAAELHFIFDPSKLEVQTITNGPLFPNVLASGIVESGAASITVGAATNSQPAKGQGVAATLRLKALAGAATPVSLRFADTTRVTALGEGGKNVLVGTSPANITISGAEGNPATPAATPTATPITTRQSGTSSFGQVAPLLPQGEATTGANASESGLLITLTATESGKVNTSLPTIRGKAAPGSTVTITIYSTPQTYIVTADANGNWVYTPTVPLEDGPHNIVATAEDPLTGQTQTATGTLVVAAGPESGEDSGIPTAGNTTPTLLLLALGFILVMSGFITLRFNP